MSKPGWDFVLFTQILSLGAFSLLVIFSQNSSLFNNQIIFWIIGIFILVFFSFFQWRLWQQFSAVFYLLSILALIAVLILADPVKGSVRWIDFGIFKFQPSEIAKIATIIALANFYKNNYANKLKNLSIGLLIPIIPAILVFIEPDIGNSIPFIAIWLGIAFASGFKLKTFITGSIIVLAFMLLTFEFLAPYQKQRIQYFLNPASDPLGAGYQIIQSKISIGSGQVFGKGLGKGTQSQLDFLPEAESDFIFATITEHLGLLGASIIIIIYTFLMRRIYSLINSTNRFVSLLAVGTTCLLLVQFTINIGMNLGIMPVTGITLPLVSYGGSSLISTLFILGVILSIKRETVESDL